MSLSETWVQTASPDTVWLKEEQQTVTRKLPWSTWDSHMHVFEPHSLDHSAAPYHPISSDISQAVAFEAKLGFHNIVFVQPSCYGYDNAYLLQALTKLGPKHARGVVALDPCTATARTLRGWHRLGVRGVRLNLKSVDKTMERGVFESLLIRYADLVRPLGWVLQMYVPMELVVWLEQIAPVLDFKFSGETPLDPYEIPGFQSLINLLRVGKTYIKFSGAYRVSKDPHLRDLTPLAIELLRVTGATRLVFATDWPHTRFNGLNIEPFIRQCIEWCNHDDVLVDRLFRRTAEELWDAGE